MVNDIALESWLKTIKEGKKGILATVLQENETQYHPLRIFLSEDSEIVSTVKDKKLLNDIKVNLEVKMNEKNPKSETIEIIVPSGDIVNLFIDIYTPPLQIMIFGAGHDAIPVAKYSISLGFETTVIDPREAFNNEENFPGAERIIAHPEQYANQIMIEQNTFVIVMNHHMEKDCQALQFALKSDAPYVGALGPYSRREKMMNHLYDSGVHFSEDELDKLHNPIGLDIGAETPEEIAFSILSEIIAIRNGHKGGLLDGKSKIHKNSSKYEAVY